MRGSQHFPPVPPAPPSPVVSYMCTISHVEQVISVKLTYPNDGERETVEKINKYLPDVSDGLTSWFARCVLTYVWPLGIRWTALHRDIHRWRRNDLAQTAPSTLVDNIPLVAKAGQGDLWSIFPVR